MKIHRNVLICVTGPAAQDLWTGCMLTWAKTHQSALLAVTAKNENCNWILHEADMQYELCIFTTPRRYASDFGLYTISPYACMYHDNLCNSKLASIFTINH